MGSVKEFELFCRDNNLRPGDPRTIVHFKRGTLPGPPQPCPRCGRMIQPGYCYYCGEGERPVKSRERRERDEAKALSWWRDAIPIAGTWAERYLREQRKISSLPPSLEDAVRYHPRCPFGSSWHPAMVALLRDVRGDHRPCGIHRTPIEPGTARKVSQAKVFGTYHRTAIKLWPGPVDGKLTVGEGIETVLSAMELMPHLPPAWAVGMANNVGMFPILDAVEELHILADKDPKESGRVGQAKAAQLAGRYAAFAKKVETLTPKRHEDFNDLLRELRRA
jgi:hypothetical protein